MFSQSLSQSFSLFFSQSLHFESKGLAGVLVGVLKALNLLSLLILSLIFNHLAWSHGGEPRVLAIYPASEANQPVYVVDSLGLFKSESETSPQWAWLCDDAVDPTLGLDDLLIIDELHFLAIAKSGLYRSSDGGCSFERLENPLSTQALGTFSAHPQYSNEIVVYTDSIGLENSVWWTEDTGLNWQSSSLIVDGTIYRLWRHPERPQELWVNHAQGLSLSTDGGRQFSLIETQGYGVEASPHEIRLLGGGRLANHDVLLVALNRFPQSALLLSLDQGQTWTVIHQVEDSYDSISIHGHHIWVTTPFEGLFIASLSSSQTGEVTLPQTPEEWATQWNQHESLFISCLKPDPKMAQRMWACGRAAPSAWIAAYSDDLGQSWIPILSQYSQAAEIAWNCSTQAASSMACRSRCLDENCDPSGRTDLMMSTEQSSSEQINEMESHSNANEMEAEPHSTNPTGCLQNRTSKKKVAQLFQMLIALFLFIPLGLIRFRFVNESHSE